MIKIDNEPYDAEWVKNSLTCTAEIMNGAESGRTQNRKMFLQYVGTFYNYKGTLVRTKENGNWDSLIAKLSDKTNRHTVELPYNDTTRTRAYYISSLKTNYIGTVRGKQKWKNTIEVQLVPIEKG